MNSKPLRFLNFFMIVGIAITIIVLALTPLVLTASLKHYHEFMEENPYAVMELTVTFYICVLPFLLALFKMKKICKKFKSGEFFSPAVSDGFRRIAIYAFADAAIIFLVQFAPSVFFGSFLYALSIVPAFILPFICVTIGLLSLVMSIVFREASEIKAENDSIF